MSTLLLKLFAAALLQAQPAAATPQDAAAGRPGDCGLPVSSRKFDEYGDLAPAEEKARLEKLAAALAAGREDTKAFIIGYAGRGARAGEAFARADRARLILVDTSLFINTRLNTLDCGLRETASTELWLTPAGASPPPCAPTVSPAPAPVKGVVRRPPRRRSGRL